MKIDFDKAREALFLGVNGAVELFQVVAVTDNGGPGGLMHVTEDFVTTKRLSDDTEHVFADSDEFDSVVYYAVRDGRLVPTEWWDYDQTPKPRWGGTGCAECDGGYIWTLEDERIRCHFC
jgi:hypothetical protein